MAGTIYKLFIIHRFLEAYYQLTKEEQNSLWAKVGENESAAGGKLLVSCNSRWCNEACYSWGVGQYPDLHAVQQVTQAHEDIGLFRYVDSETYLGTPMGDGGNPFSPDKEPNMLYQLFLMKNVSTESIASLSEEERDRIFDKNGESRKKNGAVTVCVADCRWSCEEYRAFGVIAWPSVEAQQAHFIDSAELGWYRYFDARTILGTRYEP